MPFDTTYVINNDGDSLSKTTINFPGGKDTSIIIDEADLPYILQTKPEIVKYLASKNEKPIQTQSEENNPSMGIVSLAFLALIVALLFNFDRIITWIQDKNHFKIPKAISLLLLLNTLIFLIVGYIEFSALSFFLLVPTLVIFRNELPFVRKTINILESERIEIKRKSKISNNTTYKYYGTSLKFSNQEFDKILIKHFPYFTLLNEKEKVRFIHRTRKFILNKIFYIHTPDNYKEMPILVSAAAIQLTFGIKDYLLHYFKHIHIYPEAFYRANDLGICFLEGTVTGNKISLSWKHFLGGYSHIKDGVNVGLHEFAHALYYQKAVVEFDKESSNYYDKKFYTNFTPFIDNGHKIFRKESNDKIIYSDYGLTNFQEFWAESIEIFFEKPMALKTQYPELYNSLCSLLNQDPALQQNSTLT
jgi:MtfA peptidase